MRGAGCGVREVCVCVGGGGREGGGRGGRVGLDGVLKQVLFARNLTLF